MEKKSTANQLARECIVTAMMQLTKQKPLSNITISELTEKAGVSRMTYYRNYSSKEEVFQSYINEIFEKYQEEVSLSPPAKTYGEYRNILHCFQYFEKYNQFINCTLNVGLGHLILRALTEYVLNTYYDPEKDSKKLYYSLVAYAGALFSIYMAWVNNGMKETPVELTKMLYKSWK